MRSTAEILAVGYVRVSTDEQQTGAAVQRKAIEDFCERQKPPWQLTTPLFEDIGVSGGLPTEKRPELARLIEAGRAGAFQRAVAQAVDRWSRDLGELIGLRKVLAKHGVELHSVREPTGEGATGELVWNMLGAAAQFERKLIGQRIAAAKQSKMAEGKFPSGRPPYGYCWREKRLERDPKTAAIVRGLFAEFIRLGSYRGVTGWLNAQNLRGPSSELWSPATVRIITSNPIYAGQMRHKGGLLKAHTPRLITPETWEAAQVIARAITRHSPASRKSDSPFVGAIFCGVCGGRMQTATCRKTYRMFHCYRDYYKAPCGNGYVRLSWLLEAFAAGFAPLVKQMVSATQRPARPAPKLRTSQPSRLRILRAYAKGLMSEREMRRLLADMPAGPQPAEIPTPSPPDWWAPSREDFRSWFLGLSLEGQRRVTFEVVKRVSVSRQQAKFETVWGEFVVKRPARWDRESP